MPATEASLNTPLTVLNRRIPHPRPYPHLACRLCTTRTAGHFCNLDPAALAEYEAISKPHVLPENRVLFLEGQPSTSVSILCEGRVKLTRSSRNGKTFLVRIVRPGEALGISAALSNLPYEVTAQTIEPVHFRTIDRKSFLDFIRKHGEGSLRAAESISREYRAVMSDAYRLALSESIAGRVAHLLLEFARESGTLENPQPELHLTLKHEELAFKLGSTRESVTRVLNDFKRAGILSINGPHMVLLKKEALINLI